MKEIVATNHVLPVAILEALYELDILTLRAERDILVSIRCPFDIAHGEVVKTFPGADVKELMDLVGMNIRSISTDDVHQYPDLIMKLDDGVEMRARPPSAGEEMWLIDVPGVAFVTP